MKAKVLKRFRDKHSLEIHKAGDIINISQDRFDEILTVAPLVEKIAEPKKQKKATK